jgi:putative oxidoreductase
MTTTSTSRPRRVGGVLLWAVQVVTALVFLFAALGKFTADPQVMATFDALGLGAWFRYLIGALELLGVVALFVPRLAGLAGLAFAALMVGATITQLAVHLSPALPIVVLALSAVVAAGRRASTRRLWHDLRRRRAGAA